MSEARPGALPPKQSRAADRAVRLEWITVGVLAGSIALLWAVMGSSQAMKTAWLDDIVSAVPPIVFLAAERARRMRPSRSFPYGFTRVFSIAFLLSSFALVAMGAFLLTEGIQKLASGH